MNIRIASADNVELHFVFLPPNSPFSSAQVENIFNGDIKKIENIQAGQNWWIMYEPLKLKSGNIKVNSWVSLEDIPLSNNEAAKQKIIDD